MKLQKWLDTTGTSVTAFAKQVKLSRQIVHGYLDGKLPTIPTAMRIEKATEGEVNLYSWTKGADMNPKRGKNKKEETVEKTVDSSEDLY